MPGVGEIGFELVETALTFAPWLLEIPVLGRILLAIVPGGGNDFRAMEELQRQALNRETERQTRIQKQARYVIKASEAMKCVNTSLTEGGFLLAMGKTIVNAVAGRAGGGTPDILSDRIFTCIEQNVLKQTNARTKTKRSYYARPAKGHGHGRV